MMVQPGIDLETFQAQMEKLYAAVPQDALQGVRAKAWDHLMELGLPTKRSEVFRYIRLSQLYGMQYESVSAKAVKKQDIADAIYPECAHSHIVFVNGCYQPELSDVTALPKRLVISSLAEATKTFGSFLNYQWAKSLKEETDPFAILNIALHKQGAFVYLPPKSTVVAPLQILNVIDTDSQQTAFINPRLNLFLGSQSDLKLISSLKVHSKGQYVVNMAVDITIEEESHLHYTQILGKKEMEGWLLDATRATLKSNSTFKTISATEGSATVRNDYRVTLTGENAEALLNGVALLSGKNEAHTHVWMEHQAPNCRSLQLYKNVLNEISRSSFEGKIIVRQAAQKTQAFQLNNNLLLNDKAQAYSKPNLEIFADDVKASHGSTFGQLDAEQLFYMKTRGFSDHEAKNLLVYSFSNEVIDMIPHPSVAEELRKRAMSYLT